jgi:hypothetical protein
MEREFWVRNVIEFQVIIIQISKMDASGVLRGVILYVLDPPEPIEACGSQTRSSHHYALGARFWLPLSLLRVHF